MVVGPFSYFPPPDDAGFAENLHVVGQCGLGHSGAFDEFAGALLSLLQQFQDLLPPFIAEGFEYLCPLFIDSFHGITFKSRFLDLKIAFKSKKVNILFAVKSKKIDLKIKEMQAP